MTHIITDHVRPHPAGQRSHSKLISSTFIALHFDKDLIRISSCSGLQPAFAGASTLNVASCPGDRYSDPLWSPGTTYWYRIASAGVIRPACQAGSKAPRNEASRAMPTMSPSSSQGTLYISPV